MEKNKGKIIPTSKLDSEYNRLQSIYGEPIRKDLATSTNYIFGGEYLLTYGNKGSGFLTKIKVK